jgi:hypothetical protein
MPSPVPRPLSILPKASASCGTVLAWPRRASTARASGIGHGRQGVGHAGACGTGQAGGPERRQLAALLAIRRHRQLQQLHAADAIDQRVVDLDEKREAAALEPLDDGAFPGRAAQVQRRTLQAADQFAEFALAPRPGQGGVAHVVFEVDFVVLDPDRQRILVEGVLEAPVPRRRELAVIAKPGHQLAQVILRRALGQAELQQAADMVGRGAAFGKQPGRIKRIETYGSHGCHPVGKMIAHHIRFFDQRHAMPGFGPARSCAGSSRGWAGSLSEFPSRRI